MLQDDLRNPESAVAREARFRLQGPNASARDILVIPLDKVVTPLVADISGQDWRNACFAGFSHDGAAWRAELDRRPVDLIVVIGQAGENFSQVISIGEICIDREIKTSGVLLRPQHVPLAQMSAALRSMRPWMRTLAVITEADYLSGLLHALGA
jgi:hypothetical protein